MFANIHFWEEYAQDAGAPVLDSAKPGLGDGPLEIWRGRGLQQVR